jgi:hypothetical protein
MRRLFTRKGLVGLGLALGLAALAWFGWKPALVWYCVRGLAAADEKGREKWVRRIDWLGADAVPGLVGCLAREDAPACANAEAALARLARAWGPDDPRCRALFARLRDGFPTLSAPGQEAVLEWQIALLGPGEARGPAPTPLTELALDLLAAAGRSEEAGVRARALALADVLVEKAAPGPWLDGCRDLIDRGLTDPQADTRTRAVHLTLHAHFRGDTGLLRRVVPLLRDARAAVRRAALLAVGPSRDVITEEDLLPLLHDADADVRRLCETALRSRGLQDEDVVLARLVSDSRASARLEVLYHLGRAEVDPGTWLRRLSHDPSPAVRAAAVRAAAQAEIDLGDRLRQMIAGDPSPTVRQLAAHYLRR